MSIIDLIRPELMNGSNYVPGGDTAKYRLHANELPWSPVQDDSIPFNFYPAAELQQQLENELASRYQVNTDQLVITRGSDDGIDLITRLFLKAGQDALMQFSPTFPMYAFYARLQEARLIQCSLNPLDDFSLTMNQINQSWQPQCKIIMFCNPNNPTGNLVSLDLVAATCKQYAGQTVVVVDEAYIEFAQAESASSLLNQFENLLVLRTLSKAYGMAGLRLGCILAQGHVIKAVQKIIAPYMVSSAVMAIAFQALCRKDWFSTVIARIQKARTELSKQLQHNALIEKVYTSETNFILIKTNHSKELADWFSQQGIAVRDFPANSILHHHLRITVGNEIQNRLLIDALASFTNECIEI